MRITSLPTLTRVVLTAVLWYASLASGSPIAIDQRTQYLPLGLQVKYYHDESGQLDLESARKLPESLWRPSTQATPNFGYIDTPYWLRIELRNTDRKPLHRFLVIDYPLLDDIQIHEFADGVLKAQYHTGDTHPFNTRPIKSNNFVFPVELDPQKNNQFFIRVQSQGSVQIPLSLWNTQVFFEAYQPERMKNALYYGMMLIMVLYNLFLFLVLRDRSYLYYVGFVATFAAMMAAMHGTLFQFFYPDYPGIHTWSVLFLVPATMFFATLFTVSFLNLKAIAPRLAHLFRIYMYLSLACMIGAFFLPYGISTRISVFIVILCSLAIFFSGPYAWYKLFRSARFFTVAWFFLLIGTTLAGLNKYGLIPRNAFTENGLQWGSAIEAMLLSFALADRLNRDREARFEAQRAKLEEARLRELAEQKLFYQASHNPLTGFPNAALFTNKVQELLETLAPRSFYIVLLHLSRFHEINKTLGHSNADEVLLRFSQRLGRLVREEEDITPIDIYEGQKNCVAHLEGVQFAFIAGYTSYVETSSDIGIHLQQEAIKSRFSELYSEMAHPVEFAGMSLDAGLTAGIAIAHEHGKDANTLIRNAQIAVDVSEQANESVGFYSALINPYSERRLGLIGELRKAIENDVLEVHFQPKWHYKTGRVEGFEALTRWYHDKLGPISPDEFVSLAETTGLISDLTRWVLEQALSYLADIRRLFPEMSMAVNISALNLREPGFLRTVQTQLEAHNLPPQSLTLEITETAIMKDPEKALNALSALHELGVRLSIDDFGTGHSSLSYIKMLPVDEIKIDRSFVMEMDSASNDAIIVGTTLNMCHNLGYSVVAEGVETQTTFTHLKKMHCDYAQGFYLAKPMNYQELVRWLNERHSLES